jgi:sugar lactone lactonase YvrE
MFGHRLLMQRFGLAAVWLGVVLLLPVAGWAQRVTALTQSFQGSIGVACRAGGVWVANGQSDSVSFVNSAGYVRSFAVGLHSPQALAFDTAGILYAANGSDGSISKISIKGVVSKFVGGFSRPQALAFDSGGNLYVADQIRGVIYKVTPAGVISEFATGFGMPSALAFDATGVLWVADALAGSVSKVSTRGVVTLFSAAFGEPDGLVFDTKGNLYVSELELGQISVIAKGASAAFVFVSQAVLQNAPEGLCLGAGNSIYAVGLNNAVSKISAAGVVTRVAPQLNVPGAMASDAAGDLFVVNSASGTLVKLPAGGNVFTQVASGFSIPNYLSISAPFAATDATGNAYVSDSVAGTVSKITAGGTKTIFARVTGATGLAFDSNGNLYVGSATASVSTGSITKITPAGQASVITVFSNETPYSLAFDKSGTLYAFLLLPSGASNISKISPDGTVTPFASGLFNISGGMTFDTLGNLYVTAAPASLEVSACSIFKVSTSGEISLVTNAVGGAGCPAAEGLAIDKMGRLLAADSVRNVIDYINPSLSPLPAPVFSMTKAASASAYYYASGGINFGSVLCNRGNTGNLLATMTNCELMNFGMSGPNFRTDIGLDATGMLPSNGVGLSQPGPFYIAAQGGGAGFFSEQQIKNYATYPPPSSANQARAEAKSAKLSIDLTLGSTGFPLQYTVLGTPSGGQVSGSNPAFATFTPSVGFTGIADFTFVLSSYEGTSTKAQAFIAVGVAAPAAPSVSGLSADSGGVAGGETVTVSGANLSGPAAVRFGLNPAAIVKQTASSVMVTVPAGLAGSVDVTVSTAGGTSAKTAVDRFTYH